MTTHLDLKVRPEDFAEVKAGRKTFEIRENDCNYALGDVLILCEFTPCKRCHGTGREQVDAWDAFPCGCGKPYGKFTGKKLKAKVTYITSLAQQDGYVVMAIKLKRK